MSAGKGVLIAVGGLSGSGKSTLARNLANIFNANARPVDWISMDVVRKELAGVPLAEKLPEKFYESAFGKKTDQEFTRRVEESLARGHIVIADGLFVGEKRRGRFEEIARKKNADFVGLWLEASPGIMKNRAEARVGSGDPSDADAAIVRKQLQFKKGNISWQCLDANGTPAQTLTQAVQAIRVKGVRCPS